MKLRRLTALFLSAATAVTAISMPAGTAYAASEEWSNDGAGTYTYTHGTDPTIQPKWLDIDITGVDWSTIKYVSADVTVDGIAAPAFGGAIGEDWYNCDTKTIDNDTVTIYLEPDGKVFDSLEINFGQISDTNYTTAGAEISVSNINFSTEERDYSDVVGEWYSPEDGVWCYRNGNEIAYDGIQSLNLDASSVTDWSAIKYISADVTVSGKACPTIGANKDGEWVNGNVVMTENSTSTIYLNTNGAEIADPCIEFWWCSDNADVLSANALITVNNIVFSTEERDYSNIIGEWYSPEDGKWCFRNGDSIAYDSIPSLGLENSVADWSAIKYISAYITVDGKACPTIGANKDGNWTNGAEKLTENGSTTIYLDTNGAEISDPCIEFWWCSDNADVLSANALITVSNIVFSTEERDYSDVIGEWYSPVNGTWCYKNGAEDAGEIPCLPIDVTGVDWANVTYVSADVTVDKEAYPLLGGDNNGEWLEGTPVYINNGTSTLLLYTEGKEFTDMNINFWGIPEKFMAVPANALITVKNITFSEDYMSEAEYSNITGQWVKTSDGYYYNHGSRSDIAYVEGFVLDCPYDITDVQSISITAKVAMTGGTPKSIKLTVAGVDASGNWHPGYNFPFGAAEQTIVRKYRGCITERPTLDISFGQEDLTVLQNGGSIKIYVSDITFSTEPIEIVYSTPNDLLIDDNESEIIGDNEHDIMYNGIKNIETTGTLKIYTEVLGGTQNINVFWREWSDFSNITTLETQPAAVGDGVYEIRVTEEVLKIIHEKAPNKCELALMGTGYKFLMATFTPDPDAPMPVPEEIKPDAITDTDKAQLEQSKNNTIDETKAPESAEDMEYGKAHGHKSDRKKHKDGHYMYALRIVQRVEKKDLQHAKSITITVYSKKANQYITLTADTCFSYLNINGFKVKANNKDAFLTVVLDNIPEDDEITFTGFTINYKK